MESDTRWVGPSVRSGTPDDFVPQPMPELYLASLGSYILARLVRVVVRATMVLNGLAMRSG